MYPSVDPSPHDQADDTASASTRALVKQASEQLTLLVRQELNLATAEMRAKGKGLGLGAGLLSGAGLFGILALQGLAATGIVALALVLPLWAAALIVTGVLAVIAAVLAAAGKKQAVRATPPAPQQAIDSVKADVAEIKERAHR
ncbi:phage holin family protein [Streptomyces sp. H27-G5]|uniref:phage holin family protein n=1 Tax=Streptomyces sp. H27-G5 TaxID=2996698 RepID=UPI0022719C52|nr:phage holin family protein [Streptomyces sp. H27-G5]MCY0921651.1 phage holin family protein [Streptomyces sp. H27-G5]